ncbi:MAG TPA: DNA primase [Kiritimatiellia bacterium]|nr:DNA primase [Kiritimatiellia bacterium]HRZ12532.1 DNA primase [Kiritimatiellia bacterium]HSA17610.1 DNA primase [Kiritimatiellia bacterium]
MGQILSKALLEQIRAANDIVEVVGAYLPLKRAGSSFKGLCPFHKEKTPSFHANPQRQSFHCFGCGAGGDVFRFIMQYDGVDFVSAVRLLARRAGIAVELTEDDRQEGPNKDLLLKLLEDVTMVYHHALQKLPAAEAARAYLRKRDLGDAVVRDYLLGYAPEGWDTLVKWGQKKNYSPALLEAAGLLSRSDSEEGRVYDRFRHRLMFPVRDEIGRIVGFSGRVLADDPKAAKYVNTPETPVFHKGKLLYALDKARRAIMDSRTALLCEGQIDVIRCHLGGFQNAVAAQGTALTEQHAQVLKRYADSVIVVLDADPAGQKASLRSAELLLAAGLSVSIASLPPDEDPDSLIRAKGPAAFQAVLDKARPLLDFQVALLRQGEGFSGEAGLMRAARAVLETIAKAPTAVQRDHLLRQAARELGLTENALRQDLNKLTRTSGPARVQAEGEPEAKVQHPLEEVTVLELSVRHPEVVLLFRRYLPADAMTDPTCRRLYELVLVGEENPMGALGPDSPEAARLLAQVEAAPSRLVGEDLTAEHPAQDLILRLRRKQMERRRVELRQKLSSAPESERQALDLECKQLTLDIKSLQQGWDRALPILELD